jgi:hypothetical protein
MRKVKAWKKYVGDQKGAVLILVAICFVVLLGFAALAIDVGYLMAARNELQNVADAAALAACRELGEQHYQGVNPIDEVSIKSVAKDVAAKNNVARQPVTILDGSIEIGWWDPDINEFFYPIKPEHIWYEKNSVRVTASRNDSQNGKITTFFAGVLGIDAVSVSARATAALTGTSEEGEDLIPVGISSYWYDHVWPDGEFCNQPIKFYPTNAIEGCAGWHSFDISPVNTATLRDIFSDIMNGSDTLPGLDIEDYAEFIGGNLASALCNPEQIDFEDLYLKFNMDGEWEVRVVVYGADGCSNPNESLRVLGFSTATITGVECSPSQTITAIVECNEWSGGRGGGGMYGTFGRIPGLVE